MVCCRVMGRNGVVHQPLLQVLPTICQFVLAEGGFLLYICWCWLWYVARYPLEVRSSCLNFYRIYSSHGTAVCCLGMYTQSLLCFAYRLQVQQCWRLLGPVSPLMQGQEVQMLGLAPLQVCALAIVWRGRYCTREVGCQQHRQYRDEHHHLPHICVLNTRVSCIVSIANTCGISGCTPGQWKATQVLTSHQISLEIILKFVSCIHLPDACTPLPSQVP
jgi:hypothetical protein